MPTRHLPIRRELENIAPYNSGLTLAQVRAKYQVQSISKLGSNENPLDASPKVTNCLASPGELLRLYPDPQGKVLVDALAARLSVSPEQVVLGNGSEDLIGVICRTVVRAGDTVTTLYPSFPLHEDYALLMGGKVQRVPVRPDFNVDVHALLAAIKQTPRMVMFSNPMNPVGSWLRQDEMRKVIGAVSDQTLLVIDEAYVEYAQGEDYASALEDLKASSKHWIILRTFSKAYGLAGLRIGFAITSTPEIAGYLDRARTPFNTNAIAQAAALAALNDIEHLDRTVALAARERERVARELTARGYAVAPSRGNFVFFDCRDDSVRFSEMLLAKGVITKPWKQQGYDRYVRVSIGLRSENDHFLSSLPDVRVLAAQR